MIGVILGFRECGVILKETKCRIAEIETRIVARWSASCVKSRYVAFPILAFSHYLIRLISLYCGVSSLYLRYVLRAFARERLLVPRTITNAPGSTARFVTLVFFFTSKLTNSVLLYLSLCSIEALRIQV